MHSAFRLVSSAARAVACAGLLAASALASANTTNPSFVDVAGSLSTDGFNNLSASRITQANLVAGIASNVAGSDGNAVFKRTSGTAYPASWGLYEWGGPRSTFEITITPADSDLASLVFQSFVNVSNGANGVFGLLSAANLPKLSYNGGNQLLAASSQTSTPVAYVDMSGVNQPADSTNPNYSIFGWDLSGITVPITSLRLTFATDAHSQSLAFQVDQLAAVTAAVPEPSTYALMVAGLGVATLVARRSRRAS